MKNWEDEIKQKLERLEDVPERNPLKVQSLKRNFMSEARKISSQPVVVTPSRSWWNQLFQKKETFPMKLVTIGVILSLLLGGGISAVAAQSSLPGDVLYPVKTLVEDIELGLTTDPETEFEVAFKHTIRRSEEIQQIIEDGLLPKDIPLEWQWRFNRDVEETIEAALSTEDPVVNLLRVQQYLENKHQTMQAYQGEDEILEPPFQNKGFDYKMQYYIDLIGAGIEEPELLASELDYMAEVKEQFGDQKLEDAWMNMYGIEEPDGQVGEVQNQGDVQHPVDEPFMWMHLQGNRVSEINPEDFVQGGQTDGAQNSYNDHPNGGNQGDNGNSSNGGAGGNGGK